MQLATHDALYSDGNQYLPAITAVKALADSLPQAGSVLVLGTGLGSMVHVMRRFGYNPHFTLVEQDKVVLQWAMEAMTGVPAKVTPICADAGAFMAEHDLKYDFIFIDIFNSRVVPDFVFSPAFLGRCKASLGAGGHVALNYLVNSDREWEVACSRFGEVFAGYRVIAKGANRILIG